MKKQGLLGKSLSRHSKRVNATPDLYPTPECIRSHRSAIKLNPKKHYKLISALCKLHNVRAKFADAISEEDGTLYKSIHIFSFNPNDALNMETNIKLCLNWVKSRVSGAAERNKYKLNNLKLLGKAKRPKRYKLRALRGKYSESTTEVKRKCEDKTLKDITKLVKRLYKDKTPMTKFEKDYYREYFTMFKGKYGLVKPIPPKKPSYHKNVLL